MDISTLANTPIPAWAVLLVMLIGIGLGQLAAKYFNTPILGVLCWISRDDIKGLARLAWATGAVPEFWMKYRFHNDPEEFAKWAYEQSIRVYEMLAPKDPKDLLQLVEGAGLAVASPEKPS